MASVNEQQLIASNPKYSAWVSASAGTGKTKILTDRVLRLLLAGVDPSKILCLTFTKAAAAEMSNRIRTTLSNWVLMTDAELVEKIFSLTGEKPNEEQYIRARRLFGILLDEQNNLKIQTIHSFCQSLLSRFPIEAGINLNFKILDDISAASLLNKTKNQLINNSDNLLFIEALQSISWQLSDMSIDELMNEIISLSPKLSALIISNPDIYNSLLKYYELESKDIFGQFLDHKYMLDEIIVILDTLHDYINEYPQIVIIKKFLVAPNITLFEEIRSVFYTSTGTVRKSIFPKNIYKLHNNLEPLITRLQEIIVKIDDEVKSLIIADNTKNLLIFITNLLTYYQGHKDTLNFLDYNDLIKYTCLLLAGSENRDWVLYKLNGGIDHILIDEAQDTSQIQWQIIKDLTSDFFAGDSANQEPKTIFVVGDEKQSIFSFQGADPKIFNFMQNLFAEQALFAECEFKKISLVKSYRSGAAILNLVDKIFNNESIKCKVSSSDDQISHETNRVDSYSKAEIWPLFTGKDAEDNIAKKIATEIKNWLEEGKILKSKGRKIKAGDIMILVQRRNNFSNLLVRYLKQMNVPVSGQDRLKLSENIVAGDIKALISFLLMPSDNFSLAVALKSPIFNFDEDDIFDIAAKREGKTSFEHMKSIEKYKKEAAYLSSLITYSEQFTIFDLLTRIIELDDGRRKFIAKLGIEVNDPLDELLDLAVKFEETAFANLQNFLYFLEKTQIEIKRDLGSRNDEVRIMTVHSSKGLQAPIVILPDTIFVPTSQDSIFFDNNLVIWPARAANYNDHVKQVKEKILQSQIEEYNRLLYVALTRAEDELIISGYTGRQNAPKECWYSIIKENIESLGDNIEDKIIYEIGREKNVSRETLENEKYEELDLSIFDNIPQNKENMIIINPSSLFAEEEDTKKFENNNAMLKGEIIHKLLQILPNHKNKQELAEKYLLNYDKNLSLEERNYIIDKTLAVLTSEKLKFIFERNSKGEVKVEGIDGNNVVSGRIDRLVVQDDNILIVDYKTSNIMARKASAMRQLASYKSVIEKVYPEKTVNTAIIWTDLVEIEYI